MHLNPFTSTHPAGPLAATHLNDLLAQQVFGGRYNLLPSGAAAGSYGSASAVPVVTVDAFGRIVSISTAAVSAGTIPRGHIDGLTLSYNSASTVNIATGQCVESGGTYALTLSASTKVIQSSGSWTAGTGNNGLDTGAIANSTWYHVFVICKADGTSPDILFSTSATAPTMPTGYTLKRRIGALRTGLAGIDNNWVQRGDTFLWNAPQGDVAATNPGISAITRTLSTPPGVRTCALVTVGFDASALGDNPSSILLSDLSIADTSPNIAASTMIGYSASATINNVHVRAEVWTNTSSQIRSRLQLSSTNTVLRIQTHGWHDPRGRDNL
jgi:hypothetical protein